MKHTTPKLMALTLSFLIILSLYRINPAYCTTAVQVQPGDTVVPVCTTFHINVTITDVYNLMAFEMTLGFDPTKMEAQNIEIYPPFRDSPWIIMPPEINNEEGWVHFGSTLITPPSFSGSEPLANITFHCTNQGVDSPLHLYNTQLIDEFGSGIPHDTTDGFVTQFTPQPPPINITFRILAVEGFFSDAGQTSWNFETTGSTDYPMKSAQYLITTLTAHNNWINNTISKGYKYTAYVHLLSNHTSAQSLAAYRGPPTNSNVVNEIQNFLAATTPPYENNSLTIRIFYYIGHSGITNNPPPGSLGGFFLALGQRGSHPANPQDPTNPSSYQELWDYQLNQTLNHGDLATNNCTLIILDSCRSGGAIQTLRRLGRVILTACTSQQLAMGWISNPANWPPGNRDRWGWFTGQNIANSFFRNGTNAGPLGIIGAITAPWDADNDGWLDAHEIFVPANGTTVRYAKAESQTQEPQRRYCVMSGNIPIVQINTSTPFPYNGKPCDVAFHVEDPWPGFHNSHDRTGTTDSAAPVTNDPLWSKPGYSTNASVIISETQVIVATTGGGIYSLDPVTGEENWSFMAESPILATPLVDSGTIYVATFGGGGGGGGAGGILYAINEATGLVKWSAQAPMGQGFFASPVVGGGYVFVATTSEVSTSCGIYVYNQTTGELFWTRELESPVRASLAVERERVFVATYGGGGQYARLHAINVSTAVKIWNYSFGLSNIISTPAVGTGQIVIGCLGGGGGGGALPGVYAFDEISGTPLWDYPTLGPVSSSPAVDEANDVIVFGSGASIYALTLTGSFRWIFPSGLIEMSSPAISSNNLVFIGTGNTLYCLNELSGGLAWSYILDGPIVSSPAIADNHVFIGTRGSSVYCFGPGWPEHDVAVKEVFPQETEVNQGDPVTIECLIENEGNVFEDITVTIGYFNASTPPFGDSNQLFIDTFSVDAGFQTVRYYTWYTAGMPAGTYNVSAIAHIISGEIDVADNILVNGSVRIIGPGVHDVAVTNVAPAKTVVCQTMTMKIYVEVSNSGEYPENFDVTVTAIPTSGPPVTVGTQLVENLGVAETRILTFVWNTAGVPLETYTIEAVAETVEGEEITVNNIFTDGQVKVAGLGDITGDSVVDIGDATQIGLNWMLTVPPGNPNADINDDDIIDISDATIIGLHWLETYP